MWLNQVSVLVIWLTAMEIEPLVSFHLGFSLSTTEELQLGDAL